MTVDPGVVDAVYQTVKLFTNDGGFVVEGKVPRYNEPPEVMLWGERIFIRDPFRIDTNDQWVRYREAWTITLFTTD